MIGCPDCEKLTGGSCQRHSITTYGYGMTPHCCPVCNGRGFLQAGFYNPFGALGNVTIGEETCRSCGGTGVVWR